MRATVARHLQTMAVNERKSELGVLPRHLVKIDKSGALRNHPGTVRHLYLQLKTKFKRMRAGLSDAVSSMASKVRVRRRSNISKAQPEDRIMAIENPLMLILQHCKPTQSLTDPESWIPHPVYASARHAANRGRGDLVNRMARQFLPA
jgi:hypothetical protein